MQRSPIKLKVQATIKKWGVSQKLRAILKI
jgi:hypothetical protein